jgi:hypothetical protein
MKKLRNVITLSDMDPELEVWARAEAERRGKPFYQVINEALEVLRAKAEKEGTREADTSGGISPSLN